MICKNPYLKDGVPFGCGQCLPCKLNRRRLWTHRIMLESMAHINSSFVTLTYDDKNLPRDLSLNPDDTKNFIKRLRKRVGKGLRYYLVGEYGERGKRPHYHAILFGYPRCDYGIPRIIGKKSCRCEKCKTIENTWKKGHTYLGELTTKSAQYVANYTTKKKTREKKFIEEQGLYPEYARMSNRPGIGALSLECIVECLESEIGSEIIANRGDVPLNLKHGGKSFPLGRS